MMDGKARLYVLISDHAGEITRTRKGCPELASQSNEAGHLCWVHSKTGHAEQEACTPQRSLYLLEQA